MDDRIADYFKDAHQKELDNSEEIYSSLQLPIGAVPVLSGACFYLLATFEASFRDHCVTATLFYGCIGVFLLSMGFAVYELALCCTGGIRFAYLPDAQTLLNYYAGLVKYYEGEGLANAAVNKADEDFGDYLTTNYASAAKNNFESNETKLTRRYKANSALGIATLFLAFAGIVFVAQNIAFNPPHAYIIYSR